MTYQNLNKPRVQHITFILKALLNPLAKNPPNGPITEANRDRDMECRING